MYVLVVGFRGNSEAYRRNGLRAQLGSWGLCGSAKRFGPGRLLPLSSSCLGKHSIQNLALSLEEGG